jgi:hypothetical protein
MLKQNFFDPLFISKEQHDRVLAAITKYQTSNQKIKSFSDVISILNNIFLRCDILNIFLKILQKTELIEWEETQWKLYSRSTSFPIYPDM